MRSSLLWLAALVVLVLPARAVAQDSLAGATLPDTAQAAGPPAEFDPPPANRPLRGVVWRPSDRLARATRALRRMKAAGVEAVRTPLIRREQLLKTADSLRLRLFQDLPVVYLSAGEIVEALPDLRWELERALLMARRHPSARHFGLLSRSDTSVPATCDALRELAERVRAYGPEEGRTYYETPFIEEDRCRGATDLTLLDVLNEAQPQALLRRWQQAGADTTGGAYSTASGSSTDSVAVGVGALGTWVDPDAEGLRAPHSPQSQARYFEKHLPLLLGDSLRAQAAPRSLTNTATSSDSLQKLPAVVFTYRWRDVSSGETAADTGEAGLSLADPYGRQYGLHGREGQARPAMRVVRGLYTGRQTVFAFDAGTAPPGRLPWLVLMGWGLVVVLGVVYASASRFRGMVQRYFTAPNFYRDAVREGREVLGVSSLVLLAAISLCGGLIVTVFLLAVQETGPFVQMLRGASGETQGNVLMLLQRPWIAVLVVAAFYFICLGGWAFFLSLATRQRHALRTSQALVLVACPRWPVFILALAAVVATTLSPGWLLPVSAALLAAWVLVAIWGMFRTLYDLALMADLSPIATPALVLLNPVLLVAVMVFFAVLEFLPETTFLWHLATRS